MKLQELAREMLVKSVNGKELPIIEHEDNSVTIAINDKEHVVYIKDLKTAFLIEN